MKKEEIEAEKRIKSIKDRLKKLRILIRKVEMEREIKIMERHTNDET